MSHIALLLESTAPFTDPVFMVSNVSDEPLPTTVTAGGLGRFYAKAEFVLPLDAAHLPFTLHYSYRSASAAVDASARELTLYRAPRAPLAHIDRAAPDRLSHTNSILFFLALPHRPADVALVTRLPHFGDTVTPMAPHAALGQWVASVHCSPALQAPIAYHYQYRAARGGAWFVCGRHLLALDAPAARRYVQVYDVADEAPRALPYFLPPLAAHRALGTRVPVAICAHGAAPQPRAAVVNGAWPLALDGHWAGEVTVDVGEAPLALEVAFHFDGRPPLRAAAGAVALNWAAHAARILFPGPAAYGRLAVAFSLAELRAAAAAHCGTFACLAQIAQLCKRWGVAQMRVHVETLGHPALLDPLHLDLHCAQGALPRDAVRAGKVQWALAQTRDCPGFVEFRRMFGESLAGACRSEDDLFVQYWCYSQLFDAFFQCLAHGIAVITDVAIDGNPADLDAVLPLYALFSNAVRVSDNSQFSARSFPNLFGAQGARYVTAAYFVRSGKQLAPRPGVNLTETAIFFNAPRRQEIYSQVAALLAHGPIDCDPSVVPAFMRGICAAGADMATAIIADEVLTVNRDAEAMLKQYPLILASDRTTPLPNGYPLYSLPPQFVQLDREPMLANLRKRWALNPIVCELGLEELLFLTGVIQSLARRQQQFVDLPLDALADPDRVAAVRCFVEDLAGKE
jgi:hypothetical protein